jgi:signal transduction histidine kinase/ligand-binding sensor domain-containing protein
LRSSNTCRSPGHGCVTWLLACLGAVSFLRTAYAIDPNRALSQYVRNEWTAENGFPGGAVSAIAQTTDGYLWIGGEKGLVRFDGVTFRLVQHSTQTPFAAAPVLGLVADNDGGLWVRVQGPTLLHYPQGELEAMKPDITDQESLVTAMCRATDGTLLLSSIQRGVMAWRNRSFSVIAPPTLMRASFVISLAQTPNGDVWLGTRDVGLFRVTHGQLVALSQGVPDRKVNCLLPGPGAGSGEELWIGSDAGVVRWDGHEVTTAGVPAALARAETLAMTRDRDANVWVAAGAVGLVRVSANGVASIDARERRSNGGDVTALFEDREGNLWIGTTRGIERLRDAAFTTYSLAEGMPSGGSGAILTDGDRVWFAPEVGGLYSLHDGRLQQLAVSGLGNDVIYSIAGGNGDLWIGGQHSGLTHLRTTASGAVAVKTYTQADGLAQDSVYAVSRSRDGAVWAGTLSAGASRFSEGRFVTVTASNGLASNTVNAILEAADSTMWFATSNGLSAYVNGAWKTYRTANGLPSDEINCLTEDGTRGLWAGTSAGLAYVGGGQVHVPPEAPAALRDEIVGIETDGRGTLWIATASRVLRVDRDKLLDGTLGESDVYEYGIADGLPGTESVKRYRSVAKDARGRIWLSMVRGLSVVDPMRAEPSAPAIAHVQAITADGIAIDLQRSVQIPSARQRITFDYVGLSLSVPERVRYRYRLDGFDRGWSAPAAAREAVYTNLHPGPYRFRVTASNSDGRWSDAAEASIPFDIDPAFWETRWFQGSSVLVCIAAAFALYRFRMQRMVRQLNVRFEERLAERTRIAQELHDTLLQGFVSASMQLHVAAERVPPESPAKPTIDRVLDLMSRVIEEGRNAVRGLRSSDLNVDDDLERLFRRVQQELAVTTTSDFRVIVEGRPRALHPIVRDEVHRIGREALMNAFRHANAKQIEVELEYAPHHLRMLVRDDGAGIDADVLQSGRQGHWGLSGMRERAERMGARLRLWSRKDAGTEVELSVPGHVAFVTPASRRSAKRFAWFALRHERGSRGAPRQP